MDSIIKILWNHRFLPIFTYIWAVNVKVRFSEVLLVIKIPVRLFAGGLILEQSGLEITKIRDFWDFFENPLLNSYIIQDVKIQNLSKIQIPRSLPSAYQFQWSIRILKGLYVRFKIFWENIDFCWFLPVLRVLENYMILEMAHTFCKPQKNVKNNKNRCFPKKSLKCT